MVLFRDISKNAADVISKDFPHEKPWEAEIRSKSGNFSFTQQAMVLPAGSVLDANSSLKFANKDVSVEGKFFVNGSVTFDAKYTGDYTKGLILNARFDRRKGKTTSDNVEVAAEYQNKGIHGKATVLPYQGMWTSQAMAEYKSFKLGGELMGNFDMTNLKYSMGASYANNQWTGSLKTQMEGTNPFAKLLLNVHCKYGATEVGTEVAHALADSKTGMSFGGKYVVDNNTFIKARLSQDAKVAIAVNHTFSPLLNATMGFQFDGLNVSNADAIKYGLKLNFAQ
ncbi:unnamed protein product [Vitrella brassicaformis CCMP3155]|uniref:Voltage-dependent anion-selective channel protein 1 n=2 Tax=Vitrella brassicaformis TaxID=1169539 RepID=A0A0G4FR02_VITBC|nr:unnamed protein product [Vitrella brassicaformis CCMP3155]|mmetsp:Transcript_19413/g.46912  ORF Transcript_19413/g.46912 Transcript_19413/m.46912 type:complete len:282 (+) Transcript_19413:133-978(+)|eukprot:CEM16502.1 unnamed protein product [Vitrella brassicaformis CCMP3155]